MYCCHNIINTKDLDALKDQLSFGSDKDSIKKILSGITYSKAGEAVMYSPEFFRDDGYIVVGKINTPRRTEHKGSNIEVKTKFSTENPTTFYESNFNKDEYGFTANQLDTVMDYPSSSKNSYGDSESPLSTFKYEPETYDFLPSKDIVKMTESIVDNTSSANQGVKTIAAMGLLSIGFYTVLRSVGKRN